MAPLAAALATGTLALGTFVWVYARSPYSEILQAACFLLFLFALLRARAAPGRRNALLLGAAAGALIASKLIYLVAVGGGAFWLGYLLLRPRRAAATAGPAIGTAREREDAPPGVGWRRWGGRSW